MDIVKRMILNKTPKDLPNGSIALAKNMKVDDSGSFLTNDLGFVVELGVPDPWYIVGAIPCNKEIVVFLHKDATTNESADSKIIRKPDGGAYYEVASNWSWGGGKIAGSYTYNYKGELIIAVGEYDLPSNVYVPLKTWNLDNHSNTQTYAIEEEIPTYTLNVAVASNGSLACGVYTFFIRFNIDKYNHTKWFQISGDVNIVQIGLSKKYVHHYLASKYQVEPAIGGEFNVNMNGISNKSISLSVAIGSPCNFTSCQIGYIVKRNSEVKGRIQGEYNISAGNTLTVSVLNNNFVEEVSIEDLIENPHQMFNVKNVINYNNRLYIANYKEYPIDDLSTSAATTQVTTSSGTNVAPSRARNVKSNNTNILWQLAFTVLQHEYVNGTGWTETKTVNMPQILTDKDGYVSNKEEFITAFTDILALKDKFMSTPYRWGSDRLNYYWFLQKPNNNQRAGAICLASKINNEGKNPPPSWGWNFEVPDYKIKLVAAGTGVSADVVIEYGGTSWSLLANGNSGGYRSCILGYCEITGATSGNIWWFGNCYGNESGPRWQAWGPIENDNPSDATAYTNGGGGIMPHDIHISISSMSNNASEDNGGDNTVDPGGDDNTTPNNGGDISTISGANNRTLHPHQKYNFFIHYIRKDGSFTNGFPILNSPAEYTLASGKNVLIPKFKLASNPDSTRYVGYFITYEDIESTVDCVNITFHNNTDGKLGITNAQYLYGLDIIRGDQIIINGTSYTIDKATLAYIESKLTYNHLELKGTFSTSDTANNVAYVKKVLSSIYNNKIKTLYRLTKNIYTFNSFEGHQDYLPAFYSSQVIIAYTDTHFANTARGFIIDPASSYVLGFNSLSAAENGAKTTYNVMIRESSMYAPIPTSAMNIKQDYEQAAVMLTYNDGKNNDEYTNILVSPDKLSNLLELKACYSAKPSKSYTNFNEDNINEFDKTIYRSDAISDESLVNGFRHFDINAYKNILENKGKITNIVGIGLYFLVHTEYSLFVFDRSHRLSNTTKVDIPDVFEVKYEEVLPSSEGFGGLVDKNEAILTKNGYIWYDRVNKIIFRYENGKISMLSADIHNFLKYCEVGTVRFADDFVNSRLIICITDAYGEFVTLSYNFNTSSFISSHDFKFTDSYSTYGKTYFFDSDKASTRNKLFSYSNNVIQNYGNLTELSDEYFPYFNMPEEGSHDIMSYVDIIFNTRYEESKVLNFLTYVLNQIDELHNIYNITEEKLIRRYSGYRLQIYTDETDSGVLDIAIDAETVSNINNPSNYQYPYFDKGHWNLNYFRNKINEAITNNEAKASLGIDTTPTNAQKLEARSDNRSLIYGKYFVIRFIFNNEDKIKLDTLNISLSDY